MGKLRTWSSLVLVLGLAACPALSGQTAKSSDPSSVQQSSNAGTSKTKPQKTLTLSDVTRVNTSEAARRAAQDMARARVTPGKAPRRPPMESAQAPAAAPTVDGATTGAPGVVEFQPAAAEATGKPDMAWDKNEKNKAPLKNVHGSVYGALDARHSCDRESAGSVGATSKGGKTAIYVETDHTTSPASH